MFRFSDLSKSLIAKASIFVLAVLFAQAIPSSDAANPVGTVHAVSVYAYGTVPGAARTALFQNDSVFSGQLVETVEKGGLSILFNDGTEFRLGPAASMTLDKFVYNAKEKKGALAINMMSGMFRFTTGRINKEGVQLKTPVATIGIRGTDFGVAVEKSTGNTIIQVFTGAVAVTTKSHTTPELVKAGEYISVTAQGTSIRPAPYFFAPPTVGPSATVVQSESDDRSGDGNEDSRSAPAAEPPDPPSQNPQPGPGNDDD